MAFEKPSLFYLEEAKRIPSLGRAREGLICNQIKIGFNPITISLEKGPQKNYRQNVARFKNIGKFILTVSYGLLDEMNKAEKAFEALGDPTRRLIFEKLRDKPMAVGDLAEGLDVSRPAVSQHVRVLKDARLIRVTKRGTRSICQIDPDGIVAMRFYLDDLWSTALASFKELAEEEQMKKT